MPLLFIFQFVQGVKMHVIYNNPLYFNWTSDGPDNMEEVELTGYIEYRYSIFGEKILNIYFEVEHNKGISMISEDFLMVCESPLVVGYNCKTGEYV